MTIEKMAIMVQTEPSRGAELLPIIWEQVHRLLYKMAYDYYRRNAETCARCGVEADDLAAVCYEAMINAVHAYKADQDSPLLAYFKYQFKRAAADLLGIRTERGRREPLNHCTSLDRPADPADADGATLADFIPDAGSSDLEGDVLESLNAEQEAEAVNAALDLLPERQRLVLVYLYYENQTLTATAQRLGVSLEQVRTYRRKALDTLRTSPLLRGIYRAQVQHEHDAAASRRAYRPDYAAHGSAATGCGSGDGWRGVHAESSRRWHAEQEAALDLTPGSSDDLADDLADILGRYLHREPARPSTLREWAELERERRRQSAAATRKGRTV